MAQAVKTKPTHEDWENAREKRDHAARKACQALLDGDNGLAMEHARDWDTYDEEMLNISKVLDG